MSDLILPLIQEHCGRRSKTACFQEPKCCRKILITLTLNSWLSGERCTSSAVKANALGLPGLQRSNFDHIRQVSQGLQEKQFVRARARTRAPSLKSRIPICGDTRDGLRRRWSYRKSITARPGSSSRPIWVLAPTTTVDPDHILLTTTATRDGEFLAIRR